MLETAVNNLIIAYWRRAARPYQINFYANRSTLADFISDFEEKQSPKKYVFCRLKSYWVISPAASSVWPIMFAIMSCYELSIENSYNSKFGAFSLQLRIIWNMSFCRERLHSNVKSLQYIFFDWNFTAASFWMHYWNVRRQGTNYFIVGGLALIGEQENTPSKLYLEKQGPIKRKRTVDASQL